jgi:hypothetical protein
LILPLFVFDRLSADAYRASPWRPSPRQQSAPTQTDANFTRKSSSPPRFDGKPKTAAIAAFLGEPVTL